MVSCFIVFGINSLISVNVTCSIQLLALTAFLKKRKNQTSSPSYCRMKLKNERRQKKSYLAVSLQRVRYISQWRRLKRHSGFLCGNAPFVHDSKFFSVPPTKVAIQDSWLRAILLLCKTLGCTSSGTMLICCLWCLSQPCKMRESSFYGIP